MMPIIKISKTTTMKPTYRHSSLPFLLLLLFSLSSAHNTSPETTSPPQPPTKAQFHATHSTQITTNAQFHTTQSTTNAQFHHSSTQSTTSAPHSSTQSTSSSQSTTSAPRSSAQSTSAPHSSTQSTTNAPRSSAQSTTSAPHSSPQSTSTQSTTSAPRSSPQSTSSTQSTTTRSTSSTHSTTSAPRSSLQSTSSTKSTTTAPRSSPQSTITPHSSTQNTTNAPRSSTQSTTNAQFHASFKGSFSQVFAFGGSETDTGNARFLGAATGKSSSNSNSKSNDRLSDGRLVVDFLCDELSLPTPPPYKGPTAADCKTGVNFAVAGATALSADFFKSHNLSSLIWKNSVPAEFQTQIDWFDNYMIKEGCRGKDGGSSCKVHMEKSLFWIGEIGVSDYISALRSPIPLPQVADVSVRIVCNLLKALLDKGAKYVVVQGLPPVGCFPAYMSSNPHGGTDHMGCIATANLRIMNHNLILENKLNIFRKLYPDSSIIYADYWNAYLTILTNAKKHHLKETTKPCCTTSQGNFSFKLPFFSASLSTSVCKDPQNFISWDGIHLTEAMNKNLADLFLNQGFCRPSFSEIVKSKHST